MGHVWSAIKRVGSIEVGPPRGDISARGAGLLLVGMVAVSTVAYGLTTGRVQNIWILPDELTYGLLARSFATTGHFAIRGVETLAYPIGYPLLIAAAFVHRGPVAAYEGAKWINSLLMSLAAVPAYLIARRLLSRWLSLLAVVLTLLIPSYAYTGVLMAENAFFPIVLLSLLFFVRALERPSVGRQFVALASIIPAVAARSEGLVLVPILLGSIVLMAVSSAQRGNGYLGRAGREVWRFRATFIALPLAVAAVVAGEAAVGKPPSAALGRYSSSLGAYPVLRTLRWAVYQLIDLQFYVAVLPLVPASVAAASLLSRPGVPRPIRAVAAASSFATVLFVLAAAAASQGSQGGSFNYPNLPPEVHDRYCFFVAPLVLVLFLYWMDHRHDFSNRILVPLIVLAAALPLVLPYADVHSNAGFDALALLPWHNSLIADRNVHYGMAVAAWLLAILLIPRRRSIAVAQVAIVGVLLLFMGVVARNNIAKNSTDIATSHPDRRSWIDRAVPPRAAVAALWAPAHGWSLRTTLRREQALWRAEFLNQSIKEVFWVGGRMHYDLPTERTRLSRGRLILTSHRGNSYRYAVVVKPVSIRGHLIATDAKAKLSLYRLSVPTRP
jgi:hypothetical protein